MRLQRDWCDIPLVVGGRGVLSDRRAVGAGVGPPCDPGLPAVWADHDRLEQVFVNLLNNAFKHNPPRDPRVGVGPGRGALAPIHRRSRR